MPESGHGARSILPLVAEDLGYAVAGRRLLNGVSFEIGPGPCTVILGPNGAGKTLTLRLCHGLLQPTHGRVGWRGPGRAEAAREQAMVFQRPVLLRRSVAANVDYALRLRGLPRDERRERAAEALDHTGLAALAGRAALSLSVGEQQRLALARAWALRPQVLFLDEPTASLDPGATGAVESTMRAIRASGTKLVMTTHDLGQARRLGDAVLFLHQGRLVENSSSDAFFEQPSSPEGKAFVRGELLW
ncbi:MAG: ATP-binding cassette domain-containing protein [Myxococcales bacterium]|nr:ATP-binding cassette domain-containing protein [Myxococcales bacterium]